MLKYFEIKRRRTLPSGVHAQTLELEMARPRAASMLEILFKLEMARSFGGDHAQTNTQLGMVRAFERRPCSTLKLRDGPCPFAAAMLNFGIWMWSAPFERDHARSHNPVMARALERRPCLNPLMGDDARLVRRSLSRPHATFGEEPSR